MDIIVLSLGRHLIEAEKPHCHKCDKCKTIWEHCRPPETATREEFDKAHSCPRCGQDQRWKYDLKEGETIDFPWQPEGEK